MQLDWMEWMRAAAGLVAGGVIGIAIGFYQAKTMGWKRSGKACEAPGPLASWRATWPGRLKRVFFVLAVLAMISLACPMLFTQGGKWWVTAGIGLGYGSLLFRRLRQAMR
jgi:hypothetical protein